MEVFTGLGKMYLMFSIAGFVIGLLGNMFIGAVNCLEWVKKRKVSLADFILTCLAVSRISYLLVSLFYSCSTTLFPHLYGIYTLTKSTVLLWKATNHFTNWFATSLSVLYFFKIAHFSHPLFLWLKWRMDRVVLGLLVFSLLTLTCGCLLPDIFTNIFMYVYGTDKSNLTLYSDESKILDVQMLVLHSLSYLISFVLTLISLVLLFVSLVRHTRNLELSSMGSGDASTQAHKKAMKMVLSFLFLFLIHFLCTQMTPWLFLMFQKSELIKFFLLTLSIFPSGHPFILILGNSKLRQTSLSVLWHLKCHLRRVTPSLYTGVPECFLRK